MSAPPRPQYAWAVVSKLDGTILRDLKGNLGIWTREDLAKNDCPKYGQVRRVRINVSPIRDRTHDNP